MIRQSKTYQDFLDAKVQHNAGNGFEPVWLPDFLFPFQSTLDDWAIRSGRGAIYADCGMGKTPMLLVYAENVVRKTNKRVLITTPLAVSHQTIKEGEKFGVEVTRSKNGKIPRGKKIIVTNYQNLHHFDPAEFVGCIGDESSAIKHADSKTKAVVTEFMRNLPYRLLCTATAAPNDYFELGTSSEALGELGYQDMLTRFFKEEVKKDYLGWGRKTYRFRGHSEEPFWKWVCSWSRACRKPSDLGFDDNGFVLPPLLERELTIHAGKTKPGMLFPIPAKTLSDKRWERRVTLKERCEAAAELAGNHKGSSVIWCHYNPEGDLLEKITPDAVQVAGHMADELKEERMLAFASGQIKTLVIKPKIGAWGLNWQHCHNVITFATDSWEQRYQSIRRCWRFGQQHPVKVTTITTEGEEGVMRNLKRKADQADRMFDNLVRYMNATMRLNRSNPFSETETIPAWLSTSN